MKSKLNPSNIVSFFSSGFHLEGDITAENDVRIEGEIRGNISTKKRVIIGESGKVLGDIEAEHIVVLGEVKGKVVALSRLTIGKNALFQGMAYTDNIQVDFGAKMEAGIQKLNKQVNEENLFLSSETNSQISHAQNNIVPSDDQNLDPAIASVS
ncbi:bactofilin family protein [Cyclobacterium marinum]|uniref:Integral membrane protein CcmA involved in cell shape determination n=1 Tax=Cyclobacterium marinum (strain ATCC 25205 / DSM 745 / LMG 13164 / NCIMB 1802) TaxID=880070 RepID=G0IV80_CYCMS|nr:polymer-forming cytoskeletal protein [Cyclobacterium marinum]AEL27071.1 protein of unknown function DUF583 [Cyclobacterium marinum DSM 745]MBR9776956.1 polymer-forming cytoskeletal protein [Cytophagales bacterium]|tara:strand:+ start:73291 stop:73752 length:462 start_codon:yes stop_codon:yes gene_type:complete